MRNVPDGVMGRVYRAAKVGWFIFFFFFLQRVTCVCVLADKDEFVYAKDSQRQAAMKAVRAGEFAEIAQRPDSARPSSR